MYNEKLLAVQWAEVYWSAGRIQPFPKQQPQPLNRLKKEDSSNVGPALTPGTAGATKQRSCLWYENLYGYNLGIKDK